MRKESDVVRAICDYLAARGYFFFRINNVGVWDKRGFHRKTPAGFKKGVPDLMVVTDVTTYAVEVKSATGRLSPEQIAFGEAWEHRMGIRAYRVVRSLEDAMKIFCVVVMLLIAGRAEAAMVDINKIVTIESSGDVMAENGRTGARGLCQITPVCLADWNMRHKGEQYTREDLFNPEINKKIAAWYLDIRIPQMLRHYGAPVTIENVLIAYNAGIKTVTRGGALPKETIRYIRKYNARG